MAPAAWAGACRVTDFTDKPLSSLSEVQRLSFVMQMTQTEFDRLHAAKSGDPNYYELLAANDTISKAQQAARRKLDSVTFHSIDDYRARWDANLGQNDFLDAMEVEEYSSIWATDYLTDEQLRRFLDCSSRREPGLRLAARPESPGEVHLSLTHITPIGIEKIYTRLVATHNIANVAELEKFLAEIGPQDNYTAKTFPLKLIDPGKRAVVVIRAGWETPKSVFIPVYPAREYFK
jgi:hypothetical protein